MKALLNAADGGDVEGVVVVQPGGDDVLCGGQEMIEDSCLEAALVDRDEVFVTKQVVQGGDILLWRIAVEENQPGEILAGLGLH